MRLQIPHPDTPLHLYRHMLREASYLPLLCRSWITSRVQARFHECRNKTNSDFYIKEAHHYLRYLRSANNGHVERILQLCFLATGRIGKRRRILGRTELSSLPASNSAELDKVAKLDNNKHRKNDWMDNWSIEKVKAIAFSQSAQQGADWRHNMRKGVDPTRLLPTENSLGRPVSQKLIRNKLKRHWAVILQQLSPPLPQGEWNQLGALVRGEADPQHYKLPSRRPVARLITQSSSPSSSVTKKSSWQDFVTKPVRLLERGSSRSMKTLTGDEDEDPRGHGRPIGLRVLGQRKLRRRIYSRTWKASPLVNRNPRSGNWAVTWGGQERQPVSRPRSKDLQFFKGIDKTGAPANPVD